MATVTGSANGDNESVVRAIQVTGYKSLADSGEVAIRPLTILAGANSSGKSSLMQPLLLLKQTLNAGYEPDGVLLDGENIRFTDASQLLHRVLGQKGTDQFTVAIHDQGGLARLSYARSPSGGLIPVQAEWTGAGGVRSSLTLDLPSEVIRQELLRDPGVKRHVEWLTKRGYTRYTVEAENCLLSAHASSSTGDPADVPWVLYTPGGRQHRAIAGMIHVPGLRGNPRRGYPSAAVDGPFPGTFDAYVAGLIHHWQSTKDPRADMINEAVQTLGLTWRVQARQVDATQIELLVGRTPQAGRGGARDLVSVADVGFGVSQSLPVLVALAAAPQGRLVYLEQPEIHLHPRAQVGLAALLADAAERGARLVVETHSDLVLLGIQALVAEGRLEPDSVALHWFERDQNGTSRVTTAQLDEAGRFGDWPEDFTRVQAAAQDRYLDAAEQQLPIDGC